MDTTYTAGGSTLALRPSLRRGMLSALLIAVLLVMLLAAPPARAAGPTPTFDVTNLEVGVGPTWIEVGDVTGDDELDLVVTLDLVVKGEPHPLGKVIVMAGDGDGGFTQINEFSSYGYQPYSCCLADLDGDDVLDLAVLNRGNPGAGRLAIFAGDGLGGFELVEVKQGQDTYHVGTEAIDVKAIDLDRDGDLDLVASTMGEAKLVTFTNENSDPGYFTTKDIDLPTEGGTTLGVGDLNGDGFADVAVGEYGMGGTMGTDLHLLLGNGTGSLVLGTPLVVNYLTQTHVMGSAFADFNKDGRKDIVVTTRYPNRAQVFLADDAGGFAAPVDYAVGEYAKVPLVLDLNGDGILDIVTCNYGNDDNVTTTLSVLTGRSDGTFDALAQKDWIEVGGKPHSIAKGDFDGDGDLDMAVPDWATDEVSIVLT